MVLSYLLGYKERGWSIISFGQFFFDQPLILANACGMEVCLMFFSKWHTDNYLQFSFIFSRCPSHPPRCFVFLLLIKKKKKGSLGGGVVFWYQQGIFDGIETCDIRVKECWLHAFWCLARGLYPLLWCITHSLNEYLAGKKIIFEEPVGLE